MTVVLELTGGEPARAADPARDFLRQLGAGEPFAQAVTADDAPQRDLLTGLAIASLVLSVPGAIAAALEVHDRLSRRRALATEVETLKVALAEAGSGARLTIEAPAGAAVRVTIDLERTPTDAVVDRLLEESRKR